MNSNKGGQPVSVEALLQSLPLQMSTSVLRALTTAVQSVPTRRERSGVAVLMGTNLQRMECHVKVGQPTNLRKCQLICVCSISKCTVR